MKAIKISFLAVSVILAVFSCSEDNHSKPTLDDLSPYVRQFLVMRNATSSGTSAEDLNTMNNAFQGIMRNVASTGRIKDDSVDADTTIFPDHWKWTTCATLTEITNEDGSVTTIRDYGDGCNEGSDTYYYWVHGKITDTWKNEFEDESGFAHCDYDVSSVYENYGARFISYTGDTVDCTSDGYYIYKGKAYYNKVTGDFTGEQTNDGESVSVFDGVASGYKIKNHSTFYVGGSITDVSEYEYDQGDNFYSCRATTPLVYDYTCSNQDRYVHIAVSGVEVISFRQDGAAGSFTIGYGDGECDNMVYVTENGVTVEVDLGRDFWMHVIDVGG